MMTKKCRICGRTYPIEAAFCGKCGVPLEAVDEPNNTPKPKKPRKTKPQGPKTQNTGKTLTQGKGHAPDETDALLQELNDMIGLQSVKQEVNNRINMLRVARKAEELGSDRVFTPGTLHMVFAGNPGTGKTTVARLLGRLYGSLGVLKKPDVFVECGRSDLVEKVIAAQSLRLAAIGYENIRNPEMYVEIQREDLQSVSNSGGKL